MPADQGNRRAGTVLHPRCTVLAMSGPIILGSNCIVEENVVIVNRTKNTMTVGDENHFQIGCRTSAGPFRRACELMRLSPTGIESTAVGNHNIFAPRSRTSHLVSVGSNCNIGAGCVVLPSPFSPIALRPTLPTRYSADDELPPPPTPAKQGSETIAEESTSDISMVTASPPPPIPTKTPSLPSGEALPDYTQIFGDGRRRIWSGEGRGQARAFHAKHLDYLRETLPKYNKLKMFT